MCPDHVLRETPDRYGKVPRLVDTMTHMEGDLAGDASLVLKTSGANVARVSNTPTFRQHQDSD